MSFYAVLPSNSCRDTQPRNRANNFIVDLQKTINLPRETYQVALTEFSIICTRILAQDLISYITPTAEVVINISEHPFFLFPGGMETYFMATYPAIFKSFNVGRDYKVSFEVQDNITSLYLDRDIVALLGFKETTFTPGKVNYAQTKTQMVVSLSDVYIYCSIIDPIIVGETIVPLLRRLIPHQTIGNAVNVLMDNLMYMEISSSDINAIEIQIRDNAGELIQFPPFTKTCLTLHFRQK
jgi:hypothetical protein